MAQGIKEYVAKSIKNGDSVKKIISEVVKNKECNWLDVVSTFLWWCWLKAGWPVVRWALIILGILLWVICCSIIAAVVTACVALVVLVSSPVWMPIRLWKAPEKLAKLLLDTKFEELEDPKDTPFVISENVWKSGVKVLNLMWRPVYSLLPMNRRKFFINEDSKALKTYPVEVQVAYYDEQKDDDKTETMEDMTQEAMEQVWNRGGVKDRAHILASWVMEFADYKLLFESEDKGMFNLLKFYCGNEKKRVDGKLQRYFLEQLAGERSQRAYEVLLVCAKVGSRPKQTVSGKEVDTPILEVQTLKDIITMLGGKSGAQADGVLTAYWSKNSLKNEVVKALVERATDTFVDEGKARASELLMKVVKRDGISTANAEFFFANCDSKQEKELTKIIELRVDLDKVGKSADNDENREEWLTYCGIRMNFAPEAQERMQEWQYDYYCETSHKLDEEVIYYLLVKRLTEYEKPYFEKVLKEAEKRDCLSETAQKLMVMTTWKREIILKHLAMHEKEKGYFTL